MLENIKSKILLIEDDESFVNAVRLMLRRDPIEIIWAATGADAIRLYRQNIYGHAAVIIDYCLPDMKGSEVARSLRKINPIQEVLFASGHTEPEFLIDILETGGSRTFIQKGRPTEETRGRILESVEHYLSKNRVIGADDYSAQKVEAELKSFGFIGRSPAMALVLDKIKRYKDSPYPVLIIGETGTGKELVAKALAPSAKGPIVVNCPRYIDSENLLEAELFGYVKGAFTGAIRDNPGLLTQAHGQALFLDELHELSSTSQAKLLRFLQELRYRRVGDNRGNEISVNFRLLSAAKPDILERVKDGRFLEDLYHRVSQLEIHIPPLRERPEDFEPLVRYIQDDFNAGKPLENQKHFRMSTIAKMIKNPWTGNVREFQNVVRRLLVDAKGDTVNPADFDMYLQNKMPNQASTSVNARLDLGKRDFEINQIKNVLRLCRTQSEAAAHLGLSKSNLHRKLVYLGIDPREHLVSV